MQQYSKPCPLGTWSRTGRGSPQRLPAPHKSLLTSFQGLHRAQRSGLGKTQALTLHPRLLLLLCDWPNWDCSPRLLRAGSPCPPPVGTHRPAGHAGDLGELPAAILLAADQGQVSLGQPLPALVAKNSVHLIAQPRAAEHLSQRQLRRGPTGHCRGDTVGKWEPGSAGDSSQNRDEEERNWPQPNTKESWGSQGTHPRPQPGTLL